MNLKRIALAGAVMAASSSSFAATDIFFNPLTQSGIVASANNMVEMTSPWLIPAGLSQENLTSLTEIEADINQTVVRVPGLGSGASMFDMIAFDDEGENIFIPHETRFGAGVTRYNVEFDYAETLFSGDLGGADGDWSNDYAAFDPATFTPNETLLLGEEWSGEGRLIEVLNPHAPVHLIQTRELDSIANVSHEGLRFSLDGKTLYYVDEWNSGSIYKFVMPTKGDYTKGQTFLLKVDAYDGVASDNWDEASNAETTRTGKATWVPLTDAEGKPLTSINPFRNGPTNDPRSNEDTRGGRPAADELGATPYGRPEDMEIGKLRNGNEVMYFAATSEKTIYSVEMLNRYEAVVRVAASEDLTPKNVGFAATTGELNSPDNLAQDALGNIYIIEDAPNRSSTGGDIWFIRDVDNDGVGESLDHFMTLQVAGSEATGMIFNPVNPTEFIVAVQHPSSADLDNVPEGFGDALWKFDLSSIVPPMCNSNKRGIYDLFFGGYDDYDQSYGYDFDYGYGHRPKKPTTTCTANTANFTKMLKRKAKPRKPWWLKRSRW